MIAPAGDGPVALVTGAARGIGAATVRRLVTDGWGVIALDGPERIDGIGYPPSSAVELDALVAEVGPAAVAVVGDVRSLDSMHEAVSVARGRLDAIVAAAGVIAGGETLWSTPEEQWDAVFSVNTIGVRNTLVAGVPALLARPEPRAGRIVAVASAAALRPTEKLAAYAASKAAVIGLMRSVAADLRGTGVTANVVSPGSTRTPMLDASADIYGLDAVDEFSVHHLTGELIDPADTGAVISFLCSPAAAAIHGAVVPVDGGMT